MKILYVSQYYPPEPGAPSARVSELARHWAGFGHEVVVLTGLPNHPTGQVPPAYRRQLQFHENHGGVRVHRTWLYASANRGRIRRSACYLSFAASAALSGCLAAERPDVVIGTSPQFLCAVAAHLVARRHNVPFIFEVRDLWPESIVAVGAMSQHHPAVRLMSVTATILYKAAAHLVVVTDSFRDHLIQLGVPSTKISVIKNGADLERFQPMDRNTPLRTSLNFGNRFVAAYIGTIGMAHGLQSVLDAATQLRGDDSVRFLFVGDGAERVALQRAADSRQLSNVVFLGSVPRERMPEVYATSDACLVPLRRNDLFTTVIPSKLFEIMAMQRPIILSVDGEARRIVDDAHAGIFVPPEDATAMAAAIVALRDDKVFADQMSARGRQYVTKHFDRRSLARQYMEVLDLAMQGTP